VQGHEIQFDTPAGQIAGLRWTAPQPNSQSNDLLICLHGWLDNAASFGPIAPHLMAHWPGQMVALDLPGHGNSSHRSERHFYGMWDYVTAAASVVDALNADRVWVIGHSLGGIIAGMWAVADDRIERAVWLDVVGGLSREPEDTAVEWKNAIQTWRRANSRVPKYRDFDAAVEARMLGPLTISESLRVSEFIAQTLSERGIRKQEQHFSWKNDKCLTLPSPLRMTEAQLQNMLAAIPQPTLILLAEKGWMSHQPELLRDRLAQLQNHRVEYWQGGHHFHMEEELAKLALTIHQFLTE